MNNTVENYLNTAKGLPFFYVVGDKDYRDTLEELVQRDVKKISVSDFCPKDDKFPDIDELIDTIRTGDVDFRENKYVVVGLGEYLAFRGVDEAVSEINRLKNVTLGNARVILLLRSIPSQVKSIVSSDIRLVQQGRFLASDDCSFEISVTKYSPELSFAPIKGFKNLLKSIEKSDVTSYQFSSNLLFSNSLIPMTEISDCYLALKQINKDFCVERKYGTEVQWKQLLDEVTKCSNSINKLFQKYRLDEALESEFYNVISGCEFKNWLFFIYLKMHIAVIGSEYLRFVIEKTESYEDLKDNILKFIVNIKPSASSFEKMYSDRKKLVRDFPESDIAIFVQENSIITNEEIYRLTDNTALERRRIIRWIAQNGWNDVVDKIYPALAAYHKKYVFDCGKISADLTSYFEQYKTLKLENHVTDDFLSLVEENGESLKYLKLETRNNVVNAISDKNSAYLYWIDALGVEYMAYITELVRSKGLSMRVDIARADLPTITSINSDFYNQWNKNKRYKEERLDNIKHKEKGGYHYTQDGEGHYPIHLESELGVIKEAVDIAATKLALHECSKFVIASDHGASRLAVIYGKEEKYKTDTQGEHSGRCCKRFDGCDVKNSIDENGFIVLSDYGRFSGSRKSNVEVHGGASLEEVVVPVITLTLRKNNNIDIRILNSDDLYADRKIGTILRLYISDVENVGNVRVRIGENQYAAIAEDNSHFVVTLSDIRRSKKCQAELFDGDDLIGNLDLDIHGKSGNVDKSFDSEFDF
ncbi:MAG: BREX-4 system phosphatase PglZ [Oscillospiraceae bacterium]|nr:BREX-4 system phosphatase PglZ [Oscillospiraceae bacterium]